MTLPLHAGPGRTGSGRAGGALAGRRIVVTRQSSRAAGVSAAIEAEGGVAIALPTIAIDREGSFPDFERALREIDSYDYIVVTSANTAEVLVDALASRGEVTRRWKCAAIGRATASVLEEGGIEVAARPEKALSAAIAASMGEVAGKRVLVPGSDLARGEAAAGLRALGALVDEVVAYRTKTAEGGAEALVEIDRGVDAILFSSPSTARNFLSLAGNAARTGEALVACIGPVTAAAARELGFRVDLVATEHSMEGLVRGLAERWRDAGADDDK
jgi:uroporphyrinogen-III synthase